MQDDVKPDSIDDQGGLTQLGLMQTWAAKVVALSFIALVLLGNFWLTRSLVGAALPVWFSDVFLGFIGVSLLGGGAMSCIWLAKKNSSH